MKKVSFELPIATVSEANCTEHWTKKHRRHKNQQFFIRIAFLKHVKDVMFPCIIKMIRLSPRELDSDNLQMAFKYIRDEISEALLPEYRKTYISSSGILKKVKGMADSDKRLIWQYDQSKQQNQAIRIELEWEESK